MAKLEEELRKRGIPFDHIENRIRCFEPQFAEWDVNYSI
jgi:hypothetical protein